MNAMVQTLGPKPAPVRWLGSALWWIEHEFERLQVIVNKTAGPREFEAMSLLEDYIRKP